MSDRAQARSSTEPSGTVATIVADNSKNLSSSKASQSGSSSKLTVIDANEQSRSTRKLNTDYLSGTAELNNNSIFAPGGASYINPHRMDTKRRTTPSNNPGSGLILDSSATKVSLERSIESSQETRTSTNQIPSYSSIFTSSSYRRSMSPPNQQQQQHLSATKSSNVSSGNRTSAQRQLVESEIEIPVTTITGRLSNSNSGKKLPTFSYVKNSSSNENRDDDDDDESNDDDFDERHPFNNSNMNTAKSAASRSNSNKRISSESHRCSSPCKHSVSACSHKCDASAPNEHAAHTKISFNESRPPSFSLCQSGVYDNAFNRKLDWQDLPMCFKCDCNDCYKKRKAFMIRSEHHPSAPTTTYIEKYSRTKSVHLALKSVILVLLTLLLLMLLIGVILAGHFLPGMFDRLLNVSRSFNVTIAG